VRSAHTPSTATPTDNTYICAPLRSWSLDVMGYPVNPLDVVANGTQAYVTRGVGRRDLPGGAGGAAVTLRTLDAPALSPGDPGHLLWYDGQARPAMAGGIHANVYNKCVGQHSLRAVYR